MKKVFKNLPKHNCIEKIEKKYNLTFTYIDCNTGEVHLTDNVSGKKWRTPKSIMEYAFALVDGVQQSYLKKGNEWLNFIPEDYHA